MFILSPRNNWFNQYPPETSFSINGNIRKQLVQHGRHTKKWLNPAKFVASNSRAECTDCQKTCLTCSFGLCSANDQPAMRYVSAFLIAMDLSIVRMPETCIADLAHQATEGHERFSLHNLSTYIPRNIDMVVEWNH